MTAVDELAGLLSQEDQTQTHHSTLQISTRETCLTQSNVVRIIHHDVGLKCLHLFTKILVSHYCSLLTFIFYKVV